MFGDRIKERRLALGFSAEQVAAFLNVSPATVYRYENGDISKLPAKLLPPLASFLETSPAYLMGWEPEEDNSDPEEETLITAFLSLSPDGKRLMLDRAQELLILYGKKSPDLSHADIG